MEREIRFRVSTKNGTVGYEKLENSSWQMYLKSENKWRLGTIIPIVGEVLYREQITPYTDIKGLDVYENDIISFDGMKFQVVFEGGEWTGKAYEENDVTGDLHHYSFNQCEIIGRASKDRIAPQ
ncbi:hypothetical protein [Pontibacter beigongshangensis]|uniref:hypothetical protein n=1 Tax=Pontibacter beigongshangensis TaxID=2574733 RepID=UPI00164FA19D|nr:hypothetical protein [Pontibacter beigongshangensis]